MNLEPIEVLPKKRDGRTELWIRVDRFWVSARGLESWVKAKVCGPPAFDQIAFCLRYIDHFRSLDEGDLRAHERTPIDSYRWKHDVEAWSEKIGPHEYVSNGAFITAAILRGCKLKPNRTAPANPKINLSLRYETPRV